MHGQRGVTEHGFRPRGGEDHVALSIRARVAKMPQVASFLVGDHLQVGEGGVQHGIPVDQALAAVDQAFLVQGDELALHGPR